MEEDRGSDDEVSLAPSEVSASDSGYTVIQGQKIALSRPWRATPAVLATKWSARDAWRLEEALKADGVPERSGSGSATRRSSSALPKMTAKDWERVAEILPLHLRDPIVCKHRHAMTLRDYDVPEADVLPEHRPVARATKPAKRKRGRPSKLDSVTSASHYYSFLEPGSDLEWSGWIRRNAWTGGLRSRPAVELELKLSAKSSSEDPAELSSGLPGSGQWSGWMWLTSQAVKSRVAVAGDLVFEPHADGFRVRGALRAGERTLTLLQRDQKVEIVGKRAVGSKLQVVVEVS